MLRRLVGHINSINFEINTFAAEMDKVFPMRSNLQDIPRHYFVPGDNAKPQKKPKLPDIIKTGRYNSEEDRIILQNWKDLMAES